jgi:hypothetical protein
LLAELFIFEAAFGDLKIGIELLLFGFEIEHILSPDSIEHSANAGTEIKNKHKIINFFINITSIFFYSKIAYKFYILQIG